MAEIVQDNIVSLEDYEQRRDFSSGPGAKALQAACRIATEVLQHHIALMMGKVDDALYDRAERSESNAVQTHYLEAMREMRIVRKNIEEDFIALLNARCTNGVPRETEMSGNLCLSWEDDANGVGLVDKNDLEESLAIANLVNKIRSNCGPLLFALDKRIGFLIRDTDLEKWQNPLGPESICEAFASAAGHIQSGTDIRLITYKIFDQYVGGNMDELYKNINRHLISMGVLPQIKVSLPKTPDSSQETSDLHDNAPTEEAGSKFPRNEYSHNDLSSLPGAPGILPGHYEFRHENPAINVLTMLQHSEQDPPDNSALTFESAGTESGCVNILHDIRKSSLVRNLGENGDMTIGVVAMIFDYILDDKNIPDSMRALIGRMQIPILKVALLDQTFLSRKSHPARRLLNRLAVTAVGWNEQLGNKDPVYIKIQSIVQRVLEQFDDNLDLFETLLNQFEEFMEKEEAQAQLRAARSAKVMEGQERLEVAKASTLAEIQPRIGDREATDFVRNFVTTHWKNLLFICCARNGKDSEAWKQAVATMDDLIWSIKPKRTQEDRKKLVALQPNLLKALRTGMERLSMPATERDDFLSKLVRAHGRTAISAVSEKTPLEPRAEATRVQVKTPAPSPAGAAADGKVETPVPSSPVNAAAAGKKEDPAPAMAAGNKQTRPSPPPKDDGHLNLVKSLKAGTWLEFFGADGKTTRAKLSWVSPITGTFLFTDRQGLKAGNYATDELARMVHGKLARVIDTAPLMDRAVSTALRDSIKP